MCCSIIYGPWLAFVFAVKKLAYSKRLEWMECIIFFYQSENKTKLTKV